MCWSVGIPGNWRNATRWPLKTVIAEYRDFLFKFSRHRLPKSQLPRAIIHRRVHLVHLYTTSYYKQHKPASQLMHLTLLFRRLNICRAVGVQGQLAILRRENVNISLCIGPAYKNKLLGSFLLVSCLVVAEIITRLITWFDVEVASRLRGFEASLWRAQHSWWYVIVF